MRFFFDNCVSPNIVDALECLDSRHTLVHLRTRFSADTPDVEWIKALAQEGDWIVISGDLRISRGKAERTAWYESGLTAFFFGEAWSNHPLMVQASELFRLWPTILDRAKNAPHGHGYAMDFRAHEPRQIYPPSRKQQK